MVEETTTGEPDAQRGARGQRDYTEGSLLAAVASLSWPMALDQVITAATRLGDIYFLGRLGPEVLAASSLGSMAAFVVLSASMGVGIAGLAVVARRIGEGDQDAAAHSLWQILILAGLLGLTLGGLGVLLARPLLLLLGATGAVLVEGTRYLQVSFALLFLLVLNLATNRALRGSGEPRTAMVTMGIASLVTVVFYPLLILGIGPFPQLGIVGSAVATGLGQGTGWVLAMTMLFSGRLRITLKLSLLTIDRGVIKQLIKIGLPVTGQLLLRSLSRLVLAPLIASFGASALAAYGIIVRLMMFPLSVGFGLGNAAGTLVGQNLGAGKPRRGAISAWIIAGVNVLIMTIVVSGYVIFARPLVSQLVESGPGVVDEGVTVLYLMAPAYIFSALGVVMGRALDGAGDTWPAMWVNLFTLWVVQIPAAYLMVYTLDLGSAGIWLGIACSNVLNGIILALWFLRGGWRKKEI